MQTIRMGIIRRGLKDAFTKRQKFGLIVFSAFSTESDNIKPDNWNNAKPYNTIPGPKPLPLIGNRWLFLPIIGEFSNTNLGELSDKLYKKYGSIFRIGAISEPDKVFICNPEDIEMVFRNEGTYPFRDIASKTFRYYREKVRPDLSKGYLGMISVQGKEWQDIRSIVNPFLMHPQTIHKYVESIDLVTTSLLDKIQLFANQDKNKEMPDDFINTMFAWALESTAIIALDKRLGCLDLHLKSDSEPLKIIKNVVRFFELYGKLQFYPSYRDIYKTKRWRQFVEVMDFLTITFTKYVKESESRIKETNENNMSVLQQLLKIDSGLAIATSLDLLFAGVDTTGKQTSSVLYYLACNQNAQDLLRKELRTLLPYKRAPVTKEILGQASYLKAVIKETQRIVPIFPINLRFTNKDMVLSGYQVPKDTFIIFCNGTASKLQKNYTKPLEFLPERWLRNTTGELSYKNTNPFVTLPFGFGPRSCIGKRIAYMEMEIAIGKIIRNFHVTWPHKEATFNGTPFLGIADPLKFQFQELEG